MKNIGSKKGFTLIEVLIVVAIIGMLSSIVIVGLGPAQKKGRDSKRVADLRGVQTGLELYYGKYGVYPGFNPGGATSIPSSCDSLGAWPDLKACLAGSVIGVTNIADDPTSGQHYSYGVTADGGRYLLGAKLEDPVSGLFSGSLLASDLLNVTFTFTTPPPMTIASCGSTDKGGAGVYCLSM